MNVNGRLRDQGRDHSIIRNRRRPPPCNASIKSSDAFGATTWIRQGSTRPTLKIRQWCGVSAGGCNDTVTTCWLTQAGTARGSSALVWKTELWSLELFETISPRILLALLRHADGGSLRVLVGHMECEPVARRKQWEAIHEKSKHVAGQPLLTLIDHNNIMVLGVDSADIPKELPETVKARTCEALALAEWVVDDVWVHLHGEY